MGRKPRRKRKKPARKATLRQRLLQVLRWSAVLLAALLLADAYWLYRNWPDWEALANGPVPESRLIRDYRKSANIDAKLPAVRWQPVALNEIPYAVQRAVIIAEDGRFYQHGGFDVAAIRNAWQYNLSHLKVRYGASTISQQTVKNLFLSNDRTLLRKWHEAILTWQMEQRLDKKRILEIYLNIAQFGPGIFGVQAASYYYWGRPVWRVNLRQAAELAACLPSPSHNNPARYTQAFASRANSVYQRLNEVLERESRSD
jgi:monofunctional biosynthetic peptidoglycan transglycosylase